MADKLNRRRFLISSAATAAGTLLVACGAASRRSSSRTPSPAARAATAQPSAPASAKSPTSGPTTITGAPTSSAATAAPTTASGGTSMVAPGVSLVEATSPQFKARPASYSGRYSESPQLAAQVKAGKLPPVEKRLPENPYVVPHKWLEPGRYGGTMRWLCSDTSDWQTGHLVQEALYGHSPLRWLEDGLVVGPGWAESWEVNEDLSEWTLHIRRGIRWSDGQPFTSSDVLFWWEDMVLYKPQLEGPPDWAYSSKGNLMKLSAPDDYTIVLSYDSPAPITVYGLASYVKCGEGPSLVRPKHYLRQFHARYNKKLAGKDWQTLFGQKADYSINPDCPVLTGWRRKQYKKGQYTEWERNPYYYAIDRWGHQLPYMDGILQTNIQDPQVMRLNIQQGKADYVHGPWLGIGLADVSTIKSSQNRNHLDVLLWDSGSGTGSIFFFNYDYHDPKYRKLIRNPKFRQALSLAFDRSEVRKSVYFNTGELTTGTYSPKSLDFFVSSYGKGVYRSWRDSYIEHDPERAKRMLDELGLKDVNGDGWRELPDGSKLKITLDYPSPGSPEHIQKDAILSKNWQAVGLNAHPNPMTPTSREDLWESGRSMSKTAWENSGAVHEIMVQPQVLVPLKNYPAWWAPLESNWDAIRNSPEAAKVRGTDPYKRHPPSMEPERGGPVERMWGLYDRAKGETDTLKRMGLVWRIIRIHVEEGPFFMGCVANTPGVILAHQDVRNVPRREDLALHGFVNPWGHPTPAVYDPEAWYFQNPEQHS